MDTRRKPYALDLFRRRPLQHLLGRRNDRHRLRRQQHEIGMASDRQRDRILQKTPFLHHRRAAEAEHGSVIAEGAVVPGLTSERCRHRLIDEGADIVLMGNLRGLRPHPSKMASITRQPRHRTAARPFRTAAMPSINSHSPIASTKVVGSGLRQVLRAPGGGRLSPMPQRERPQPIGIL